MLHQFRHNIVSGVFACVAASCAKVGFDFDQETSTVWKVIMPLVVDKKIEDSNGANNDELIAYAIHAVFIVLMICANILMLRFYVLSMQENGAAKATVQNFSVQYLASIAFGWLFFNEIVTVKLCLGVVLILAGVGIISTCSEDWDQAKYNTNAEKVKAKSKSD